MADLKPIIQKDPQAKLVMMHETVGHSMLKDAWTFGCIFMLAWLNHEYLGGSAVLDVFAVIAAILQGLGKTKGYHVTVAELREIFKEDAN